MIRKLLILYLLSFSKENAEGKEKSEGAFDSMENGTQPEEVRWMKVVTLEEVGSGLGDNEIPHNENDKNEKENKDLNESEEVNLKGEAAKDNPVSTRRQYYIEENENIQINFKLKKNTNEKWVWGEEKLVIWIIYAAALGGSAAVMVELCFVYMGLRKMMEARRTTVFGKDEEMEYL